MLERGKVLFEKQGIRKTTIDELTEAVGISKGAFYQFFDSKEELYLEILEQIEREIQSTILDFTIHPKADAHKNVSDLLKSYLLTMEAYPLVKNFGRSDFDYLVRKIPAERVLQHANSDEEFTQEFIRKIEREGISVLASPRIVSNLIRSLFFIGLQREDFDEQAYDELMNVLIDLVAGYVAGEYHELRS
jgi:AcrR family transcriptional regulator